MSTLQLSRGIFCGRGRVEQDSNRAAEYAIAESRDICAVVRHLRH